MVMAAGFMVVVGMVAARLAVGMVATEKAGSVAVAAGEAEAAEEAEAVPAAPNGPCPRRWCEGAEGAGAVKER